MTPRLTFRVASAALAAAALAAACAKDPVLVGTTPPPSAPFMARYVAIGNSITAGYQSGGINDSTQRRSYARMLALAAGATFNYPALNLPGCPPPILNFLTGARVAGDSTTCALRSSTSITAALNNVAVPGANSFDAVGRGIAPTPTPSGTLPSLTVGGYNPLTQLFLGGQTQVQRAVQLDPTFATVWIGNNDVLAAALQAAGDSTRATTVANFTSNYAALVNGLTSGSPHLKGGVLIGVVNPTAVPLLIPITVFNPNQPGSSAAAFQVVQGLFGVGTRRPATFQIQFAPNCTNSHASITFPALAGLGAALPATLPGYVFNCGSTIGSGATAIPQTPNLVTDAEITFFARRVADYNAYIKAKADSIGFAYYDPNVAFAALQQQGAIPPFPNVTAPTAPFATAAGRYISNDGVHPSTSAHFVIANQLIQLINGKYMSSIRALTPADTTGL